MQLKPGERKRADEIGSTFFRIIKEKQLLWIPPDPTNAKNEYNILLAQGKEPYWKVIETSDGNSVIDSPVKAIRRTNKEELVQDLIDWAIDMEIFDALKLAGDRKYCTLSPHLGFLCSLIASETRRGVFQQHDLKPNPLILNSRERLFFLYAILYSDSWFYSLFAKNIISLNGSSSSFGGTPEGINAYKESWKELANILRASKSNTLLSAAKEIANTLKDLKDESCYQRVKNKLETLYDLGLLNKQDAGRFEYEINDQFRKLATDLPSPESMITQKDYRYFLKQSFFKIATNVYDIPTAKMNSHPPYTNMVEDIIIKNYRLCISGIVARIENVEFLSCLDLLDRGILLEMSDIHKIIIDWNIKDPKAVSIHVNQFGIPSFIRIEKKFIDQKLTKQ